MFLKIFLIISKQNYLHSKILEKSFSKKDDQAIGLNEFIFRKIYVIKTEKSIIKNQIIKDQE